MMRTTFTLVLTTMSQVQHLVLFKFKPKVAIEKIEDIFKELSQLQLLIPGITYFAYGFLMTFDSVEARDNYLPYPEHEQVKQKILPWLEDLIAFDFEV